MTIEPESGEISWTPTLDQAGKELEVNVQVRQDRAGKTEVLSEQTIELIVDAVEVKAIDNNASNATTDEGGAGLPAPNVTTTSTTGGTNKGDQENPGGGTGQVCTSPSLPLPGTGQTNGGGNNGGGNNGHPDGNNEQSKPDMGPYGGYYPSTTTGKWETGDKQPTGSSNHEQSKPDMGPYGGYYPSTTTGKWGTADGKQGQSKPGKSQQGNHGNKRPGNKIGQVRDMVELFKQKNKAGKQQAPIGTSRQRDWPYNSSNSSKKKTINKKRSSRSNGNRLEDLLSSKQKNNQARKKNSRRRKSEKKTDRAATKNNQSSPRKSKVQTFSPNSNNLKRTSPSLQKVLDLQNKSEQWKSKQRDKK